VFRAIELRANLLDIEVSEVDGICNEIISITIYIVENSALHLRGNNPTFACIIPLHLRLFFQGKYR
jgi:flagellar biosynthesis regulator FlaF